MCSIYILYTLNLHVVCQLNLSKTGGEKRDNGGGTQARSTTLVSGYLLREENLFPCELNIYAIGSQTSV